MKTERESILELLENGRITAQEAIQLLDCLPDGKKDAGAPGEPTDPGRGGEKRGGKKLRVQVKGDGDKAEKVNVNISVPMSLAYVVDNLIENCLPNAASDALKSQGIDPKAIRLGDMLSEMESLDEDMVNLDIDSDEGKMKVRVYVE